MDYNEALTKFGEITTSSQNLDVKIDNLLSLGNDYLETSMAIISRVNLMVYKVYRHASPPDTLSDGQIFPLGITYCQMTLTKDKLIAVGHAERSIFRGHPAYKEMRLETYIGVPIRDERGQKLGTVNFSAAEKHSPDFSDEHQQFAQKLADWLSAELVHDEAYMKA